MSDQNRYINAYIDHAVGMLHENLTVILQTKSQLRVANDLVAEKDKIVNSLQAELEQFKTNNADKDLAIKNAQKLEADYNALKSKLSHMDTLLQQMNDMKKTIVSKTDELNRIVAEKDAAYKSMITAKEELYNKMVAEKDAAYNKIVAEKDSTYHNIITEKDSAYNSAITEKENSYKNIIASKDAEIEELNKKIANLQSLKKTINRKKPIEISKSILEETPGESPVVLPEEAQTVIPVILPVVQNENTEQVRETDDF